MKKPILEPIQHQPPHHETALPETLVEQIAGLTVTYRCREVDDARRLTIIHDIVNTVAESRRAVA